MSNTLRNLKSRARRYGLTLDELDEVMTRHGGACPLHDSKPVPGRKHRDMVIDHCHETGRVRDYICRQCNTEVGWYEQGRTDIWRPHAQRVIEYVDRWRQALSDGAA